MYRVKHTIACATLMTLTIQTSVAHAGMPTFSLHDVARMRLQAISFFALVILLSAWGVRRIWNSLSNDFPKLPNLSFRGALSAVILWGLVFVVVLTMISGARELMSPGAWVKNGLTYKLADDATPLLSEGERIAAEVQRQISLQSDRMARLQQTGLALKQIADGRNGAWPSQDEFLQLPDELRLMPGDMPFEYIYHGDTIGDTIGSDRSSNSNADAIVIIEPVAINGAQRFAFYQSGQVRLTEVSR